MPRTCKNEIDNRGRYQWNTALYIRLSREDGDKLESDSIGNQRDMLLSFLNENPDLKLYNEYIDDGYTGTNFNRPNFERMINDMENKNINCIIVKDLSRFGRDYIGVGNYQENIFPKYDIRFIAINDRIDTYLYKEESQSILTPIRNIFNQQYAQDISNKVRSALDTKRKRGEFIGAFACYGYMKDPNNKNHIIIDEEVADNVRSIFKWFIEGTPKLSIAFKLNEMGIVCPSEYKKQKGLKYVNTNRLETTTYWTHTSVHRILKNEIYIGNMVQHTQTNKSFKDKHNVQLDKSDWIIVPNTHHPIIDINTWNTAQRLLGTDIKKSQYSGEIHLFAGLLKCSDCGRAMMKRTSNKQDFYICGSYKLYGKNKCESHSIPFYTLTDMVENEIRAQISKYIEYEKLKNSLKIKQYASKQLNQKTQKIEQLRQQLNKDIKLKDGLYEDYKSDILTKDEYINLKYKYDNEINKLQSQIGIIENDLTIENANSDINKSMELILKYKNFQELNREMVVSLINRIEIGKNQNIENIDFNFNIL